MVKGTLPIDFELHIEKNGSEKERAQVKKVPEKEQKRITEEIKQVLKRIPRDEVFNEAVKYFKGDELAANVWINKYALKDSEGNIYERSPDDMHRRLAKEFARIEQKYPEPMAEQEIYDVLKGFKYIIPQGGPMSGIGNDLQIVSLSNCFVIGQKDNPDSYGAIMKTDEEQVQLMKRRGGVGHDLSHIRPYGTPVKNSALTSTGVRSFMERYSNSTREVAQDGRRGALMLSLSIRHPDIEDFVDAKQDQVSITGANISIRIDDEFMKAVDNDADFELKFPVNGNQPKITKKIKAKKLWEKIVRNSWNSGEPGILFWDTVINESIPDCYTGHGFKTVSTNPCGEIPLCPYDSCRLLAINLYSYVKDPFSENSVFNTRLFKKHVRIAQRLMDDLVDLEIEKIETIIKKIERDPEPDDIKRNELDLWKKIKEKCIQGRRTGLGVTGSGDMLAALGLRYGSDEAIEFSREVQKTLALEAYRSSVEMAGQRAPFPVYNSGKENNNPFISRIKKEDPDLYKEMTEKGRRNIALLTIAPTGSTSLMTQTTSGIEPLFRVFYKRRRKINPGEAGKEGFKDAVGDVWEEYPVFHHNFITWLEQMGYDKNEVAELEEEKLKDIIKESPYYQATAEDVDWISKVKMQGAVQKWVDHSISVTVNIPNKETPELVGKIFKTAWESGCKGITIYRDGSRSGVLITDKKDSSGKDSKQSWKRPKMLEADLLTFRNDHEKWIAVIGLMNGKPYEIFTGKAEDSFSLPSYVKKGWVIKNRLKKGKSRYDFQFKDQDGYRITIEGLSRAFNKEFWNYAKLISGIMRHGMPIQYVVNVVSHLHLEDGSLNTWKNGVIRALSKYIPNGTKPRENTCPRCKEPSLVYEEGCLNCKNCGHTKCE